MKKTLNYEDVFEHWWNILAAGNAPTYEPQFTFHEERKWAFDFCWKDLMIAVECDGGRWAAGGGKHATADDYMKIATATSRGWLVLRFNGENLTHTPIECIALVMDAIRYRDPSFVPSSSRVIT